MSDTPIFRVWDIKNNSIADYPTAYINRDGELFNDTGWDDINLFALPDHIVRDWFTGFHDANKTSVYENDVVQFNHDYWTHANQSPDTITAVVTWDARLGAWTLVNTKNPAFRVMLSRHIRKGKVIGRYATSDTQE